jgi:hypothetical protein
MTRTILYLDGTYAHLGRTKPENCEREGVAAYKSSPYRLNLQVRSHTEKVGYYATASLTANQCRELAQYLNQVADELSDESGERGESHAVYAGWEESNREKGKST